LAFFLGKRNQFRHLSELVCPGLTERACASNVRVSKSFDLVPLTPLIEDLMDRPRL
jgi:hypothetical protein